MKLTPRTKKLLAMMAVVTVVITLAGCRVPTNEDGSVKLITSATTFNEIFQEENWFFAIFVWPLCWVLNSLSPIIGVGWSIALVTVVVNGLLAFATLNSQMAMQEMQLIQPEIDKIQRKYEGRDDDASRMKMAQEQQRLMKEHNINPGSMFLVQFIQLPIVIAMFMAIQRAESVATGRFLGMDLQIKPTAGFLSLFKGDISGIGYVIVFLAMAATQIILVLLPKYLQKKKAEAEAAKHHRKPIDTKGSSQNQMMQYYMIGMVILFGLMWSSGMSLYWLIRNIVDIVKTIIVQNIIDQHRQEKAGARR